MTSIPIVALANDFMSLFVYCICVISPVRVISTFHLAWKLEAWSRLRRSSVLYSNFDVDFMYSELPLAIHCGSCASRRRANSRIARIV